MRAARTSKRQERFVVCEVEVAERELKPKAPTLAWEKVTMVKGWILSVS